MNHGTFVISLDFELMWGVWDSKTIESYGKNILEVHHVIPRLISLFDKYSVGATFATVGFLFHQNKEDLLKSFPNILPEYTNTRFSPYLNYIQQIEEKDQPYYFCPELISLIQKSELQEIGTHTYAHIYCLEKGMSEAAFEADLIKAIDVAKKMNINIQSLVFPRNQFNEKFLKICHRHGLTSYRGNELSWIYAAKSGEEESLVRRAIRLMDSYINITGHHCNDISTQKNAAIINIPASRFFRPFSKKLSLLEKLKVRRIKKSMTYAAKNNLLYHLWWHPHNFGTQTDINFQQLEEILQHYLYLKNQYGMKSMTMSSVANEINHGS